MKFFKEFSTRSYFLDEKGRDYSTPISCYLYFMLGTLNFAGLDIDTSRKVLDLSWIDPAVRDRYGNFLVFILSKVIEKEGVNIFAIPRTTSKNSVAVILCTSKKYGYSIYLERKDIDKTNNSTWVFNKEAQDNALKIYSKEKMIINSNDPIWFRIQHWTSNTLFNNTKLGAAIYSWILLIGGALVAFALYEIISKLLRFILNRFYLDSYISHYKKHAKRLSKSTGLLTALYLFELINFYYVIFYYQLFILF